MHKATETERCERCLKPLRWPEMDKECRFFFTADREMHVVCRKCAHKHIELYEEGGWKDVSEMEAS